MHNEAQNYPTLAILQLARTYDEAHVHSILHIVKSFFNSMSTRKPHLRVFQFFVNWAPFSSRCPSKRCVGPCLWPLANCQACDYDEPRPSSFSLLRRCFEILNYLAYKCLYCDFSCTFLRVFESFWLIYIYITFWCRHVGPKAPLEKSNSPRSDPKSNDMEIAPLIVDEHCLEEENTVLSRWSAAGLVVLCFAGVKTSASKPHVTSW